MKAWELYQAGTQETEPSEANRDGRQAEVWNMPNAFLRLASLAASAASTCGRIFSASRNSRYQRLTASLISHLPDPPPCRIGCTRL